MLFLFGRSCEIPLTVVKVYLLPNLCTRSLRRAALMENNMEVLEKIKNRTTIPSSYSMSGYFSPKNSKTLFEKIYGPLCSLQHYSQQPRGRKNLHVHQCMNNKQKMIYTFNGILFSLKKTKSSHMWQHGWILRTLLLLRGNELATEGQILSTHDYIYMRYLKQSNS